MDISHQLYFLDTSLITVDLLNPFSNVYCPHLIAYHAPPAHHTNPTFVEAWRQIQDAVGIHRLRLVSRLPTMRHQNEASWRLEIMACTRPGMF